MTWSHPIRDRPVMMSSINDPVDKIFLLGIAAHVVERQNRDRWLVWQGYAPAPAGEALL